MYRNALLRSPACGRRRLNLGLCSRVNGEAARRPSPFQAIKFEARSKAFRIVGQVVSFGAADSNRPGGLHIVMNRPSDVGVEAQNLFIPGTETDEWANERLGIVVDVQWGAVFAAAPVNVDENGVAFGDE